MGIKISELTNADPLDGSEEIPIVQYGSTKKTTSAYLNKTTLKTLDRFVEENYGKRGTTKREKFEKGYEEFRLGVLIQQARIERGMTQEQLAEKCGTNKGYISKIENDIKEVRLSTLRKIVELGLGGKLELAIKL